MSREHLDKELHQYTTIQIRITDARHRIDELEELGVETSGAEVSELATLKVGVVMLLKQRQIVSDSIRRIQTRLHWKYD